MSHVFRFLGEYSDSDKKWLLGGDESQHFQKVLRLETGAEIEVFDGMGRWGTGVAEVLSKSKVEVSCDPPMLFSDRVNNMGIALGAISVSDFEEALPSLVELGVTSLYIFLQDGVDKKRIHDKAQVRWQRIALSATKQCKRNWLPEIICLPSLDHLKENLTQYEHLLVFDKTGQRFQPTASDDSFLAVIGGEKGLDSREFSLLENWGFKKILIGQNILRARTAVISAATLIAMCLT